MYLQGTIGASFTEEGRGIHSGEPSSVTICPAPAGHGLIFQRVDLPDPFPIPALAANVVSTRLATSIGVGGQVVSMVEHLLAALLAARIDNARILVDGPEIPALDGSSQRWLQGIKAAGRTRQAAPRRSLVVRRPVLVQHGPRKASLLPSDSLQISVLVDYDHPLLRRRSLDLDLSDGAFKRELCWARTFAFSWEIEALRKAGYIKGGSLENAVLFDRDGVVNPEGLRAADEAARHKALDAMGDLALVGMPLRARLETTMPGHTLHVALLRELLARPEAWSIEDRPGTEGN